jgi:CrcB protein
MFVMTGICGGFTTFSTFGLETLHLARDGEWMKAAANVAGSVVLCLLGVWLGHALAVAITER